MSEAVTADGVVMPRSRRHCGRKGLFRGAVTDAAASTRGPRRLTPSSTVYEAI